MDPLTILGESVLPGKAMGTEEAMSAYTTAVPAGFLNDQDIKSGLDLGLLIQAGTYEEALIRPSSYMLRLGSQAHVARAIRSGDVKREFAVVHISEDEPLVLEPGDTALLYTKEILTLPADIQAFTVARGLMFAEALCPENTYVDPGFRGSIYITTVNISQRRVTLRPAMPIARIFFYRLADRVRKEWVPGVAQGIVQQVESVRSVAASSEAEASAADYEALCRSVRSIALGGNQIVELVRREQEARGQDKRTETDRLILLASFSTIWPVIIVVVNTNTWLQTQLGPFGASVLSSMVAVPLVWLVALVWNKLSRRQ
jgi:deoxycytidine triphosphate deaminase